MRSTLALCCTLLCLGGVGAAPGRASEVALRFGGPVQGRGEVTGATRHRLLHFTFDDGPDLEQTPRLLDALDRFAVKATFFFSTSRFASHEARNRGAAEIARDVGRRGHALGSHSFDHVRMSHLRPPQLREQLGRSESMFQRVFGARTFLFRAPFGAHNRALEKLLAERRYTAVMWNVGLADWVERPPQAVAATFWKVLARNQRDEGQRGGIVLLHDTHAWSVDAFSLILEEVRARNCELLGAGEELYDIVGSLAPFIEPPDAQVLAARQAQLRSATARRCRVAGDDATGRAGARRL